MTWVKIDDAFSEHPKLAAVGPLGWGVWLAGLAYCNRNLTDGFIPYSVAEGIGGSWRLRVPMPDGTVETWTLDRGSGMHGEPVTTQWVIELLVSYSVWEEVAGGYRIHDYGDYQPTRAQVHQQRATKQRAGAAGGRASAEARGRTSAEAPAEANEYPVARSPLPVTRSSKPVSPVSPAPAPARRTVQRTPERTSPMSRIGDLLPAVKESLGNGASPLQPPTEPAQSKQRRGRGN